MYVYGTTKYIKTHRIFSKYYVALTQEMHFDERTRGEGRWKSLKTRSLKWGRIKVYRLIFFTQTHRMYKHSIFNKTCN